MLARREKPDQSPGGEHKDRKTDRILWSRDSKRVHGGKMKVGAAKAPSDHRDESADLPAIPCTNRDSDEEGQKCHAFQHWQDHSGESERTGDCQEWNAVAAYGWMDPLSVWHGVTLLA